jgi:hypothetical protein
MLELTGFDGRVSDRNYAACSDPPAGAARWSARLVTDEVLKRRLVPRVGRETIRVLLQKPRPQAVAGRKCGASPS